MNLSMEKDPAMSTEEKFLTRWSRRKDETAKRAQTGNLPERPLRPVAGRDDDSDAAGQPAAALTDEQMPPIESLTEDSDFSGFLSPGVSEGLRKQALRKLFGSPGFNIRDGLDDYDDDFRNFAALGDLITSDMKHQMEVAEERKRREADAAKAEGMKEDETAPDDGDGDDDNAPDQQADAAAEREVSESEAAESETAESEAPESEAPESEAAADAGR